MPYIIINRPLRYEHIRKTFILSIPDNYDKKIYNCIIGLDNDIAHVIAANYDKEIYNCIIVKDIGNLDQVKQILCMLV